MKEKDDKNIISINEKKILKQIDDNVDPNCHEMMKDFMRRFEDDALTGK